MTSVRSPSTNTKTRAATRRIESFRQRFGDGHFYLACHAALPVALTPDLLYSLWANFQQDTQGETLTIPWIAVADLMLSNLCKEVGQELYEMDGAVRDELLNQLQQSDRFGLERVRELADFVMAYIEQQLDSPDLDVRDLATSQQWRALAYKNPPEAAHAIASTLAQLPLSDKAEWIRMAALTHSLSEPLSAFQALLNYVRAMADLARGKVDTATTQMAKAVDATNRVQVEGVSLPIPDTIHGTLLPSAEQDKSTPSPPNRFVRPWAIAGGGILMVLLLFIAWWFQWIEQPNSQSTPLSSATPTPQSSPFSSPTPLQSVVSQQTPAVSQTPVASQSQPERSPLPSLLQPGDSSSAVTTLQERLAQAGYYDGPPTGFYDSKTEDAIMGFQQDNGFLVDGVYGPDMDQALTELLATRPSTPPSTPSPEPSNALSQPPTPSIGGNNVAGNTYEVGALTITGDRQHVCNVLLPRGPGIGGSFFYPEEEALWKELECENLYCDLSNVSCRNSLKPQWARPDIGEPGRSSGGARR